MHCAPFGLHKITGHRRQCFLNVMYITYYILRVKYYFPVTPTFCSVLYIKTHENCSSFSQWPFLLWYMTMHTRAVLPLPSCFGLLLVINTHSAVHDRRMMTTAYSRTERRSMRRIYTYVKHSQWLRCLHRDNMLYVFQCDAVGT